MRFFKLILLLSFFTLPFAAWAKPIVADLSQYHIAIDSDFTGTRILLFGARNETGDILVVVRGPQRDFTVRKKERVFGIWVNNEHVTFDDVPYYYTITSSQPLQSLTYSPVLAALELDGLDFTHSNATIKQGGTEIFKDAFLEERSSKKLYQSAYRPVSFMGETLFKTIIEFPDTISRGNYSAEIYLIDDGQLVGMQSIPIEVNKTGLDAFIFDLAHEHAYLYGLLAVLVALGFGLGAHAIFENFRH